MAGFSRKKYFALAKSFSGKARNCLSITIPRVHRSLQRAYIGRRLRPRIMRRDWISSINAAIRDVGVSNYSTFIFHLNQSNVILDRKILSDLAQN